jgi:hypothetical protein
MLSPLRNPHRFALMLFGSLFAIWIVVMFALIRASALPREASGPMLVVFEPGIPADKAFAAIVSSGAKPIRETSFSFIWVVDGEAGKLEQNGALGAYRELPINPTVAGCIAVADAKVSDALGL